jgi:hypothetical protein
MSEPLPSEPTGRDRATDAESVPTDPPAEMAYDPPDGAEIHRCPECDRPFPEPDLVALHRGLEHDGALEAADREAVANARESEHRRLRLFRLRTLVVLVVLYFGLLILYALVT